MKEFREKNGYTQQALANEIGCSRSIVAKWEAGEHMPSKNNISKICELYNIAPDKLFKSIWRKQ